MKNKDQKLEENKIVDILNNIKSFSSLKKFTICSIFLSIILLFLPWAAKLNPINIIEMKNELFDIINFKNIPFKLNLFFNLGCITTLCLIFTVFIVYKGYYKFAILLKFLNIIILVFAISSNYSYYKDGELASDMEDAVESIKEKKSYDYEKRMKILEDIDEVFNDYGFTQENRFRWMFKTINSPSEQEEILEDIDEDESLERREKKKMKELIGLDTSIFHFTPILFILLFFANWISIFILYTRKKLESSQYSS